MTPPTNPWRPGPFACPFELIALRPGTTVTAKLKTGAEMTGTLVAVNREAICLDDNGDRYYAQFTAIDFLLWTS